MYKKLAKYCTERGLTVTGNKAYGIMDGFETNVIYTALDNVAPIRIHLSFYCSDTQKMTILDALRAAAYKFYRYEFTQFGLLIGLNGFTGSSTMKRLPEQLDRIFAIIKENGGDGSVCPVCGKPFEEENKRTCSVDGITVTIDNECKENLNAVINAENKEFNEAPNNYLFGFFGALIGGIVGGVLSVVLYLIGFVASASAVVAAILGAFLYQKFHGKPNKMMIVIVSLTTIVCMALSVLILYVVVAGIASNQAGAGMSAFEAFSFLMQSAEPLEEGTNRTFAQIFYTDLAMVLLFSAVGIGFTIFYLARKIKRKQSIE